MPKKFEDMVSAIWSSIKGKKNPRTNKPFTESDAYAMAVAKWKAMGHKPPTREKLEDWHTLEFFAPIQETTSIGRDFIIKGTAINETTTRNGIKYVAKELENAAPTFKDKKLLLDHKNEVKSIVGVVTNSFYNPSKHSIDFEGKVMDVDIQKMINDGRLTDVSIGAQVQDLVSNKDSKEVTAVGIKGLEVSFVAIPGDPGANFGQALEHSLMLKEKYENEDEFSGWSEDEVDDENKEEDLDEAEKRFGYEPPEAGDAPQAVKNILARAYASARKQYDDKTKCSKIAWGAVHNAGWSKDASGKWHKKEILNIMFCENCGNEIKLPQYETIIKII